MAFLVELLNLRIDGQQRLTTVNTARHSAATTDLALTPARVCSMNTRDDGSETEYDKDSNVADRVSWVRQPGGHNSPDAGPVGSGADGP